MRADDAPPTNPLTIEQEEEVDRLCDAFEAARRENTRQDQPDLSCFLDGVPPALRNAVRTQLVPTVPGYRFSGELLGVGGMGEVYRAEEEGTGRVVAVKLIHGGERGERLTAAPRRFAGRRRIVPIERRGESRRATRTW